MEYGEIWEVNFSPQRGDEIRKVRPAVIISSDSIGVLDLRVIVPITDGDMEHKEWQVDVSPSDKNGLGKKSIIECFHIKSTSTERFHRKRGVLDDDKLEEVKSRIKKIFAI